MRQPYGCRIRFASRLVKSGERRAYPLHLRFRNQATEYLNELWVLRSGVNILPAVRSKHPGL